MYVHTRYGACTSKPLAQLRFSTALIPHHLWSVHLYRRWTGLRGTTHFGAATLAALAEPFTFQLLRHCGAAWGWLTFLSGRRDWGRRRRHAVAPSPFEP